MPPCATGSDMDSLIRVETPSSLDSNNNPPENLICPETACSEGKELVNGLSGSDSVAEEAAVGEGRKGRYSLRPRSLLRPQITEYVADECAAAGGGDGREEPPPSCEGGAGRRGGGGRRARRQAQPLSRYRRRTANARERERMREINAAFEALRRALPPLAAPAAPESDDDDASEEQQRAGEKVTKVATLRLAIRYITELTRALETVSYSPPSPALLPGPCSQQPEVFSVPYSALHTQQLPPQPPPPQKQQQQTVGEAAALQLGVSAAVSLPPVSTLILPQGAPCGGFFAGDAAAGCEQLLTPPPSLTPSSSLGADCVAPALDDAWPPPDLCLTPPPLLDDAFLAPR